MSTIVNCRIDRSDSMIESIKWGGNARVIAVIGDMEQILFSYYDDELKFTTNELLGLTREEAKALHSQRDVDYIRSLG